MSKEVKIIWFSRETKETEHKLAQYLDEGWVIVAAGGGAASSDVKYSPINAQGFVVLQRG
jgi:hypothetical protein